MRKLTIVIAIFGMFLGGVTASIVAPSIYFWASDITEEINNKLSLDVTFLEKEAARADYPEKDCYKETARHLRDQIETNRWALHESVKAIFFAGTSIALLGFSCFIIARGRANREGSGSPCSVSGNR